MFYIENNNKIILFDADRQKLESTLLFMPQYQNLEIKETDRQIVNFEWADTPEYLAKELKKAKENKIKENNTARDTALNQGVIYKDVLFDSDTDQKVNLLATVGFMSDEDTVAWFGMDNQILECNKLDLVNIGNLIIQLHSFCWAKNARLLNQINNAQTIEELNNIDINYNREEE